MAIGGVVIQFRADADQARRDINKLTGSLKDVDSSARRTSGSMSKIAKVGWAALAAGAVAGAAALYDFAKAAVADYQEAEKLARTLATIPGVTQSMIAANASWIDSMELATTISDTQFRESIARLAVATGDLGKAQELASLAADVAVGRNMSLLNVTKLLEKAAAGNTSMLKRQMPWLDANRDGTITFAEAIRGLTEAYGGAAEAAANNNPWGRIKVVWDQLKEALGQFILPLLQEFSDWFANEKNRAKIQEWIGKIGEWSRTIGEELLGKLQTFVAWLQSPEGQTAIAAWSANLRILGDAFGAVAGAIDRMMGWWNKLPEGIRKLMLGQQAPFFLKGGSLGNLFGMGADLATGRTRSRTTAQPLASGYGSGGPGGGVVVNINNPRAEKPSTSVAAAIRVARTYGGRAVI